MGEFKRKNVLQRMRMSTPELEVYYRNLRRYRFEQGYPLKGIKWREKAYRLFVKLVQIDRILSHEKIIILKDEHTATQSPTIFAATHAGGLDITRICEAIRANLYIFLGDPGEIYKNIYGLLAFLNGWIPFYQ